jgi:hypothetical protein
MFIVPGSWDLSRNHRHCQFPRYGRPGHEPATIPICPPCLLDH